MYSDGKFVIPGICLVENIRNKKQRGRVHAPSCMVDTELLLFIFDVATISNVVIDHLRKDNGHPYIAAMPKESKRKQRSSNDSSKKVFAVGKEKRNGAEKPAKFTKLILRWQPEKNVVSEYSPRHPFGWSRDSRVLRRLTGAERMEMNCSIFYKLRECFRVCGLNDLQQNGIIFQGLFTIEEFGRQRVMEMNAMLDRVSTLEVEKGGAVYLPDQRVNLEVLLFWTFECRRKNVEPTHTVFDEEELKACGKKLAIDEEKAGVGIKDEWKWVSEQRYSKDLPWMKPWSTCFLARVNHSGERFSDSVSRVAKEMEQELVYESETILSFEKFIAKLESIHRRLYHCGIEKKPREKVDQLLKKMNCANPQVKLAVRKIKWKMEERKDFEKCAIKLREVINKFNAPHSQRQPDRIKAEEVISERPRFDEWDRLASPISEESIIRGWIEYNNQECVDEPHEDIDVDEEREDLVASMIYYNGLEHQNEPYGELYGETSEEDGEY